MKAGNYFQLIKELFPLQKYVNELLLPDQILSPDDEIRIDHEYLLDFVNFVKKVSGKELEIVLKNYLYREISKYLPNLRMFDSTKNSESIRKQKCLNIVSTYETNFETAFMKSYFNEKDKNFMTAMVLNIERTLTTMISEVGTFWDKKLQQILIFLGFLRIIILFFRFFSERLSRRDDQKHNSWKIEKLAEVHWVRWKFNEPDSRGLV